MMRSSRGFVSGRSGFSVLELLIVMVILGVVAVISYPRLSEAMATMNVRSAKLTTAKVVVLARALAVQNGRSTQFVRQGNTVRITIDSSGTQVLVGGVEDLGLNYGVTLSASRDVIQFDPRGFAVGSASTTTLSFARREARDSVCIVGLGRVSMRGCPP